MKKNTFYAIVAIIVIVGAVIAGYFYYTELTKPKPPKEELVIGVFCPRSGSYKWYGDHMVWAIEVAVDEINEGGGIWGMQARIVVEDSEASAEKGVLAVQKLILEDNVDFLIGCFSSSVAMAVAPVVAQYKIPFICTGAATDDLTNLVRDNYDTYKYIFRTAANTSAMSSVITNFVTDVWQPKTYAAIWSDYKVTRDISGALEDSLAEQGVTLLEQYFVSFDTLDTTPEFNKILNIKPDFLLFYLSGAHYRGFMELWYTEQPDIPFLASTVAFFLMDDQAIDMPMQSEYATAFCWGSRAPVTPKTIPYYDAFVAHTGKNVYGSVDLYAYDATYILKEAIEKAKSIDADAVIEELEKTDYVGAGGRWTFTNIHQARMGVKGYVTGVVVQWQNGKKETVWPLEAATATWKEYWK